jgi:hypothetical protein
MNEDKKQKAISFYENYHTIIKDIIVSGREKHPNNIKLIQKYILNILTSNMDIYSRNYIELSRCHSIIDNVYSKEKITQLMSFLDKLVSIKLDITNDDLLRHVIDNEMPEPPSISVFSLPDVPTHIPTPRRKTEDKKKKNNIIGN